MGACKIGYLKKSEIRIALIRYIEHKADSPKNILNMIFERALKELPGSYKLWYNYLKVSFY